MKTGIKVLNLAVFGSLCLLLTGCETLGASNAAAGLFNANAARTVWGILGQTAATDGSALI